MSLPTCEFTVEKTDIPGLLIIKVNAIGDDRGWYQEKFQKAKLVAAGFPEDFNVVQTNFSYNKTKGVTRGIHAEPWDKYISVVKGSVFAAYVDLRPGDSFGKKVTVEIDNETAIFLPRGVGNSFQVLEDDTYYFYNVNDFWSAEKYAKYTFVNLGDEDLAIEWPIPLSEATMSDRDATHPKLKDANPYEG